MGVVRMEGVTRQLGGRVILDDVTLELHDGEIVGLVGPNGVGKTTLFRLVMGQQAPDVGAVTRSRGLEIGYLPQQPELDSNATVHDAAAAAFTEILALEARLHELSEEMAAHHDSPRLAELMQQYERVNERFIAAGGYGFEHRLGEILGGLGFSEADRQLRVSALSGGQKCRVALARLLLQDSSLLLLDEPTNHLDIDAVRWLEEFLRTHHGGAAIISHDRYLLDRVADRIVELEHARLTSYPGNYSNYASTRALRRLTQERQFEKDQAFLAKERDFIARHLAGQRSNEAKGRRTRMERRKAAGEFVLERPTEKRGLDFQIAADVADKRTVLRGIGLSKSYGTRTLFQDLSFELAAGQRLGITGPNGTGKTTLLDVLVGRATADAGRVEIDAKTSVGYYRQDSRDLNPELTILQEIQALRPEYTETMVRGLLGRFLFSGDDVFKRVSMLSGGEQSRVRLLKLILAGPALLILDEPTNHLDIPSREALEEALDEYPGTILAVSHDRYFLDRVVDRLLVLREGRHESFRGNYTMYSEELERRRAAEALAREREQKAARAERTRGAARGPGAATAGAKRDPYARWTLEQIEAGIMERESRIGELHAEFGQVETGRDPERLAELQEQLDELSAELDELNAAWQARVEKEAAEGE